MATKNRISFSISDETGNDSHTGKDFHNKYWADRGVTADIVDLNVRSVSGVEAFELLYGRTTEGRTGGKARRNDGRLNDRYLRKYRRFEGIGGWIVSGIDPKTWGPMDWFRFRVTEGVLSDPKTGKAQRYASPGWGPGSSRAIFLRVPEWVWELASERFGVPITEADWAHPGGFWHWAISSSVPVIVTEGEAKAGCLLSLGFPTVSIPGIWMGRRNPKFPGSSVSLGPAFLTEDLAILDSQGKEIIFWFDSETRADKAQTVAKAVIGTGKLFQSAAVTVCRHPGPEKGVDDFVMAGGDFEAAVNSRKPLEVFKAEQSWQLSYSVSRQLSQRYLGELDLPPSGLIAIKSAKGTGKTTALKRIAAENNTVGIRTLVLTHRIVLGEAICASIGLPWVTELVTCEEGRLLGFGLCVDSLRPDGRARIRAQDWEGATLIIDEAEQVIQHMLGSSTCLKERVAILETFRELVSTILRTGGRVILQDADLSDLAVDFVRGQSDELAEPHVLVNTWKPRGDDRWQVTFYDTAGNSRQDCPSAMLARAVTEVSTGGRVFVCADAQRAKSTWGTKTLERYFHRQNPNKRILRIDSESVGDPKNPAYGCAAHLNEIVADYDIVICSPTIATGVSLDLTGHFTGVYGVAQGAITSNEIVQALSRVRESVPRYVWVRRRSVSLEAGGSASPREIYRSLKGKLHLNMRLLENFDFDRYGEAYDPLAARTFANYLARNNAAGWILRETVLYRLREEGHSVTVVTDSDPDAAEEVKAERDAGWEEEAQAVASAPVITRAEYERLQEKHSRTGEELLAEQKYKLAKKYGVPVTPVLKKLEDKRWFSRIYLHYSLTVADFDAVKLQDRRHIEEYLEAGGGKFHLPDMRLRSSAPWILRAINFQRFLDPDREWRESDPEVQEVVAWLVRYGRDVKTHLGVSVSPELAERSPIRIVQNVLARMGVQLIGKQQRIAGTGERERVYRFGQWKDRLEREEAPELRAQIFAVWKERERADLMGTGDLSHSA